VVQTKINNRYHKQMGAPSKSTLMSSSSTEHPTKPIPQPSTQKGGIRNFFLRRPTPPPSNTVTEQITTKYEQIKETTEHRRQSSSSPATTKKKGGLFWNSTTSKKDVTSTSDQRNGGLRSPSSGNSSENLDVVLTKFANHFHDTNNNDNVTERISSIRPLGHKSAPTIIKPIFVQPSTNAINKSNNGIEDVVAERSPTQDGVLQWHDNTDKTDEMSIAQQKQMVKERDGFCRRVDKYDGSVIYVDDEAAYELGNYLGGGVAGVVYEGHRLLPESAYPVRRGLNQPTPAVINTFMNFDNDISVRVNSLLSCVPAAATMCNTDMTTELQQQHCNEVCVDGTPDTIPADLKKNNSYLIRDNGSMLTADTNVTDRTMNTLTMTETVALEAVDNMILIDEQDAPSRSKHLARAVKAQTGKNNAVGDFPSDASFTNGFMEETVAIKILNPVGFRALAIDVTNNAVVARRGAPYQAENPITGQKNPMEEKHVWWLINPSSRNLRTLQRYSANTSSLPRGVEVDRGSAEKGLRISVIAAYQDPVTNQIKELPLTKCIEIWGHFPFEASDKEFRDVMLAIENINQGLPPPPIDLVPGRVGTGTSSGSSSFTNPHNAEYLSSPTPMIAQRT
jgi:hypothetical protein